MKTLSYIPLLVLSQLTLAENTITVSEGIEIHAINSSGAITRFVSDQGKLVLPNGNNQLVISYTAEIKNGNDYELEQSHPTVMLFQANNENLTLKAPSITTQRELEKLNTEQNWQFKNKAEPFPFKASLLPLKGFRLGINYERELAEFNQSNQAASLLPTSLLHSSATLDSDINAQTARLFLLKDLYMNADTITKKAFKEFIKTDEY